MTMLKLWRYIWASPNTALGLFFLLPTLCTGGSARFVDGVLELDGGFARYFLSRITSIWLAGGARAMTLGHVVLALDADSHDSTRDHERVHVRQCERWGPLFLPAYLGCSLWLWLSRRECYYNNPFEREAYRITP